MNMKYIVPGLRGTYRTRHEAIGALTKYGEWENGKVTPIVEECLIREADRPEHLGNKYYNDRDRLPTTHGVTRIERESLVRFRNGNRQDVVENHWEIKCPICYRTHKSDEGSEDARANLIDVVLDCCEAEWFPPSNWVEDCDICDNDHRGEYNCRPPGLRDSFPGVEEDFSCGKCGWNGNGEQLQGPNGDCPDCYSPAVMVMNG